MSFYRNAQLTDDAVVQDVAQTVAAILAGAAGRPALALRLAECHEQQFFALSERACRTPGLPQAIRLLAEDASVPVEAQHRLRPLFRQLSAHPESATVALDIIRAAGRTTHRGLTPSAIALLAHLPDVADEAAQLLLATIAGSRPGIRPAYQTTLSSLLPHVRDDATAQSLIASVYARADEGGFEARIGTLSRLARDIRSWRHPATRGPLIEHASHYLETAIPAMSVLRADPEAARQILKHWGIHPPRYEHQELFEAAAEAGVRGYPPEALLELAMAPTPELRMLGIRMADLVADAPPLPDAAQPTLRRR